MRKEEIEKLPYRNNVCCVVCRGDKFLLVQLNGWPKDWWKFPQGGIEGEETPEAAAARELGEEVNLTQIFVTTISQNTHQYEWSEDSVRLAGFRWKGQIQRFVLVELPNQHKDILPNPEEIQAVKWASAPEVMQSIDHDHPNFSGYKEAIYSVLQEFGKL